MTNKQFMTNRQFMKHVPVYPIFRRTENWNELKGKDEYKFGLGGFVPNALFVRGLRLAILDFCIEKAKVPVSRMERVLSDEEVTSRKAKVAKLQKKFNDLEYVTFFYKLE